MKITRAADYAVRLLTYLAAHEVEGTSEDLAREIDVPLNHLAKLVPILARRGYLITRKGKGGGLRLAVDPRKINLAEVLEAVEGPLILSDCIFHRDDCRFSGECKVRQCFSQVRQKIEAIFSKTSIYDLAPSAEG